MHNQGLKSRILLILVTCTALTLQAAANTPNNNQKESHKKNLLKDGFQLALEEYKRRVLAIIQNIPKKFKNSKDPLGDLKLEENVCLGGQEPSSLSPKQYIEEFAKGPCSPVVVIPGAFSSKLRVQINCEVFKIANPDGFKACGWSSCDGFFRPKDEYQTWLPGINAPFSLILETERSRKCFQAVMGLQVIDTPSKVTFKAPHGITIAPTGATPETCTSGSQGECGFASIENLLPLPVQFQGFSYFRKMKQKFLLAGYKIGASLQALPYDWRMHNGQSSLNETFPRVISTLKQLFGKKVTIVSHSLGNLQTAYHLWKTDQTFKDANIARYLAMAPPFIGAPRAALAPLGMDDQFMVDVFGYEIGFNAKLYISTGVYWLSYFDLFWQNVYTEFADAEYVKAIKTRIQAEATGEAKEGQTGSVMDIFPGVNEICLPFFKKRGTNKCHLGIKAIVDYGEVLGTQINYNNIETILARYSYNRLTPKMRRQTLNQNFTSLPNLGVQTNILFSTAFPTFSKFYYDKDPRTETTQGKVYYPDRIDEAMGDGTVLSTSALTAGIKWAQDFKDGVSGAKPVNFVEICSHYNPRSSIFEPGTKEVTSSAYFGVNCSCQGRVGKETDGGCADHIGMVSDDYVINFVVESAVDGVVGQVGAGFESKSDAFFEDFEQNCRLFQPSGVN